MEITLISFGKISELIPSQTIVVTGIKNTDELKQYLENKFPELTGMKYKLAHNKNLVQQNQEISAGDSIAIMPPFSGG